MLEQFLAIAAEHPHRPAVSRNGSTLTYAELAAGVRATADRLGSRPGVVAVPATHRPGTVAALLAVWAAGGTYCPVDPAYPLPRRQAMLDAVGARAWLDPDDGVSTLGPDAPASDNVDSGTAYILFTSGSTGAPKAVLTPHTAIAATVASLRELFGVGPADRVLQFASLNWDTCFEEILPTLTSGGCLVFHDDAQAGSVPRLLRLIERERISVLDLPTAYWHELVHYLHESDGSLPAAVRLVIIGGEAARPARLADWQALPTGHARLLNTYGCTETTLITHAIDLHGPRCESGEPGGAVPIGRALPHVVEHITEDGELLVGGPGLATGYRGLATATAARFVEFGGRPYFHTGDRVSRRPDGALVHEGRIDGEIKIRGVRVDPAEVEAHIAGHPGVHAVAVTGVRVADHTVLAAVVVARSIAGSAEPDAAAAGGSTSAGLAAASAGGSTSAGLAAASTSDGLDASILEYLRGRVPAHLIPSRIRVVPELVYTASGKVDRFRLKEALS